MSGSVFLFFVFFSSRRRHTRYWRDWSSDVCSSDLGRSLTWLVLHHWATWRSQRVPAPCPVSYLPASSPPVRSRTSAITDRPCLVSTWDTLMLAGTSARRATVRFAPAPGLWHGPGDQGNCPASTPGRSCRQVALPGG